MNVLKSINSSFDKIYSVNNSTPLSESKNSKTKVTKKTLTEAENAKEKEVSDSKNTFNKNEVKDPGEKKDTTFYNSNGTNYKVIQRSRSNKNALLTDGKQWIIAITCPMDSSPENRKSWSHGHYFWTKEDAIARWNKQYMKESCGKNKTKVKKKIEEKIVKESFNIKTDSGKSFNIEDFDKVVEKVMTLIQKGSVVVTNTKTGKEARLSKDNRDNFKSPTDVDKWLDSELYPLKEGYERRYEKDIIMEDIDKIKEDKLNKRVKRYKTLAGLSEDVVLTEENLDDWSLRHVCNNTGWDYDRARKEIIGRK